jgi:hypothetical protein
MPAKWQPSVFEPVSMFKLQYGYRSATVAGVACIVQSHLRSGFMHILPTTYRVMSG